MLVRFDALLCPRVRSQARFVTYPLPQGTGEGAREARNVGLGAEGGRVTPGGGALWPSHGAVGGLFIATVSR